MDTPFFTHPSWREFLRDRYQTLKATKPKFSARWLARKSGLRSPSYFQLVIEGERQPSAEALAKFALGLGLSKYETECLVTAGTLEAETDPATRRRLADKLARLAARPAAAPEMAARHVAILAEPLNLKLYLLAQHTGFKLEPRWLLARLPERAATDLEKRLALLLDSGLWLRTKRGVQTLAPTIRTGDALAARDLERTHENLLAAASRAVTTQAAGRRIVGGRTFLFDPRRMAEVEARIEAFKQELEAEFETLASDRVYQLHLSFFELEPHA